ncbi:hypothetical protein DFH94DRAFT_739315, partial [Russula ochroleuca]
MRVGGGFLLSFLPPPPCLSANHPPSSLLARAGGGFSCPNPTLASTASKWGRISRAPNPHLCPKREWVGFPLRTSLPRRLCLSLSTSYRRRRVAAPVPHFAPLPPPPRRLPLPLHHLLPPLRRLPLPPCPPRPLVNASARAPARCTCVSAAWALALRAASARVPALPYLPSLTPNV